ncbi:MAG: PAS domain S-box protein, partial [Planctomycetota bacterium]
RLFDFVPEYDKARSVSDFQALVAGRRVQGQMDIITPKGIITVEYRDTPIVRAGEVIGVQIILTDITEHKKAEEALSESEEKYRTLVQQSPLGIAIAQRHPFRLVFANPAMAGITDYSIDELISLSRRDFGALIHPEGRATFFKRFKDRWEGKPLTPTWEFRIVRKDGKLRWLEFSCKRIKYEGRLALQATFADITKHKRAEEALRKSEEHYRMLAETMNDGLGQMDENGRYVYVNNKFGEMFGYSPDEIVGRSWTDFFDEDAQKIINEQLTERRKGISKPYELKNTRKDGQKIFLRMSPQPIFDADNRYMGSISILTDITERKKAEEQIAKLAKFPAEDPNPVLRISGRGTVVYANKAGAILLKAWSCSVGQSLPNPWHELVLDALSSGQSQRTEAQCDDRIFSLIFAPVVDANYVNVYGHDITERKKTENELIENQAKLKAMASKILMTEEHERQRLAVGLHDEVCQKLVLTKLALESSLQLVSDSKVLASLRIACGGIGETIEQADSLTFELSNPVLHQLGFVIALEKYLTEEIRQKHGIEYELESDEQLGTMQDEIKNCLFRVTRELLTNVVKHAHARKVKVSARESQSQIYVRVQDDGVGFKYSEVGAEISQTARFGLFSIREQLEYLGGHLEIESEPGRGTTATVVVPQTKKTIV